MAAGSSLALTAWASNQGQLEPVVEKLFRGEEIFSNSRGTSKLVNPNSNQSLEIDVWIPSSSICFEFQDDYHYTTTWYSHIPLEDIQLKDDTKRGLLRRRGDTLVLVPFWWDGKESNLVASVRFLRPDLLVHFSNSELEPISLNPPSPEYGAIPDVGQLMPASFPSNTNFTNSISASNSWWMGEKYDGIRCCWHPTQKELYTRSARPIQMPQKLRSIFGSTHSNFVDGEIWFGRGTFSESQVMLSGELESTEWPSLRLIAFDDPVHKIQHLPFEMRYAQLLWNTKPDDPLVTIASRLLCVTKQRVTEALAEILEDGGEGVILRRPSSLYERFRTMDLVKLKASRGDLEGLVTSVNSDNTVSLQLPDGVSFKVPTPKTVPKKGDVVTFSYDSYSVKSVPLNPRIFRIRSDMTWEEAIYNFEQQISETEVNEASRVTTPGGKKPYGFWLSEKGANMRNLFLSFAKDNNLDPLKASSWYNISAKSFNGYPGIASVMYYFKGSYIKAITHLFPELNFDTSKFLVVTQSYWKDMGNRRKFFDFYAKKKGFDPLIPSNWYNISYQSVLEFKGGNSLLATIERKSLPTALMAVYPEIGFVRSKFGFVPRHYWEKSRRRRRYFEEFAAKKKFNPLIADNWYSVSTAELLVEPNAYSVLWFHEGSLPTALSALFPEVKFNPDKFPAVPRTHLEIVRHRKKFLKLAEEMKFDPLKVENWYKVTRAAAVAHPGMDLVLACYNRSFHTALENVFPELNFDRRKFVNALKWHDVGNRRNFFDEFAKSKGFDPLVSKNWYSIKRKHFQKEFALGSILTQYAGSLVKALYHTYPEIGFQDASFTSLPKNHWDDIANRKHFFDMYAKKKKFDPLNPKNWYKVNPNKFRMLKRAPIVLSYTHGSIPQALMSLYPDIGLKETKFARITAIPDSAKDFFENYAKENKFDPLVANNWYSVPFSNLLALKRNSSTNKCSRKGLVASLMSVYPQIGLVYNKFNLRRNVV